MGEGVEEVEATAEDGVKGLQNDAHEVGQLEKAMTQIAQEGDLPGLISNL